MYFKTLNIGLMLSAFVGIGTAAPTKYSDRDDGDNKGLLGGLGGEGLLNLSPEISPDLDLSGNNECLGLGVSVCDPINVNGEQNVNKGSDSDSHPKDDQHDGNKKDDDDGQYLINISPDISPEIDASDNNGCAGIGISACDPINVNGTQNAQEKDTKETN